jgi:hypothetical protein
MSSLPFGSISWQRGCPPLVSVASSPALLSLVSNRVGRHCALPGMPALQPLQALNKSSARIATFAVRPCGGRLAQCTYTSKKDQRSVTAHKFEAWLVGNNPQDYCIGFVKGSEAEWQRAKERYHDGTVWALSKVSFDTFTTTQCQIQRLTAAIGQPMAFFNLSVLCSGRERGRPEIAHYRGELVVPAPECEQKLRKFRKGVHTVSTEKRSHSVTQDTSSCDTKKARTLQAAQTEASLPE